MSIIFRDFLFILYIFISLNVSVTPSKNSSSYESICVCSELIIDCSNHELSKVPSDLPSWASVLKLNKNVFTDVPYFTPNNLTVLNLGHNKISSISRDSLNSVSNLETLELNNNDLKEIDVNDFPPLTKLLNLNLNHNEISRIENGSFNGLTNLTDIKLSRNKLSSLNKDTFKQLKSLRNIELNRNQIIQIGGLSFLGLDSLYTLKMRQNNISELADGAFYGLWNLRELYLDNNKLTRVSKGWLYGLDSLLHLNVSNNKIQDLNRGWESCSRLKELDLSNNKLETIQRDTFEHLFDLELLKLDNNRITYIEDGAFEFLPSLEILDLSNNFISWIVENTEGAFVSLKQLAKLSLVGNKISHISKNAYTGLISLNELDLYNNEISTIEENVFEDLPQLKKLALNSSSLICDCLLDWFADWLSTTSVQINASNLICVHPSHLKKKSLQNVSSKELVCQDNDHPQPEITTHPEAPISLVGNNVTLRCGAISSSNTDMTFSWKMNNHRLDNVVKERYKSVQDQEVTQFCDLLLMSVSTANNGVYQCVVSNTFGVAYSKPSQLSVLEFPSFVKTPANVVVKVGGTARLECSATGNPMPQISWQKDGGTVIPAAQEKRMKIMSAVSRDEPFFIENVKLVDAGVYTCSAHNEAGVNTANATFTVLESPKINKPMEDKEIRYGESAVLECLAEGSPKPKVTWTKDKKPVTLTKRHFLAAEDQLLVITDTVPNDSGVYECELSNGLGSERGKSVLIVSSAEYNRRRDDYEVAVGILITTLVLGVVITSAVWVIIIYLTRKNGRKSRVPLSPIDGKSENSSHSSKDSGTGDSTKRSYQDLILTSGNTNHTSIMHANHSESPSPVQESTLPLLTTFHPIAVESSPYVKDINGYSTNKLSRSKTAALTPPLHFPNKQLDHSQNIFCASPANSNGIQCACLTATFKKKSTSNVVCDCLANSSVVEHNCVLNQCSVVPNERDINCYGDISKRPCSIPVPFHTAHSMSTNCCRHHPNSYLCLYVPPAAAQHNVSQ